MKNIRSTTGRSLSVSLIILVSIAFFAIAFFVLSNSNMASAGVGPKFNTAEKSFIIHTDNAGDVNNVEGISGQSGSYEQDFVRISREWRRDGDYFTEAGAGNSLEICGDGDTFDVWLYVHNSVNIKHNHSSANTIDFKGSGVAKNATVQVDVDGLDKDTYTTNPYTITGIVDADNAGAQSDTVEVYCNEHAVAISTDGVDAPEIYTYAAVEYNEEKHEKAQEVFGSGYTLSTPDTIFTDGSKIGYDGNLPACRYYATYIKLQLKVVKKPPVNTEVIEGGIPESAAAVTRPDAPETSYETKIVKLGSESNVPGAGLVVFVLSLALVAGLTRRTVVAHTSRRR